MQHRPIRILVDCHVFDGTFQGTTTYLKGLYQELIKDADMQFFLVANDTDKLQKVFGTYDNVTYLAYRSGNKFIRLLFDLPKLIRKYKIDYAHFQYVAPPIKQCKHIVTLHDVLFLDFPHYFPLGYRLKNRFLFGTSARHADVVLTVSNYSKQRIQKHFGISEITITPNAVDPVFFEAYDKKAVQELVEKRFGAKDYWLFVSRWEPRKNHDLLLRVFVEKGFYNNYELVFIGDPAIPNKTYEAYYHGLDALIKQKIKMLNKVNFDDLLLLVRGATLSVYPSVAEGFGIPPLEALAANVPAICSNATAMSDFDFMSDWLFDPSDPEDLAQKAHLALQAKDAADKREKIARRFSWTVAAQAFNNAIGR